MTKLHAWSLGLPDMATGSHPQGWDPVPLSGLGAQDRFADGDPLAGAQ